MSKEPSMKASISVSSKRPTVINTVSAADMLKAMLKILKLGKYKASKENTDTVEIPLEMAFC